MRWITRFGSVVVTSVVAAMWLGCGSEEEAFEAIPGIAPIVDSGRDVRYSVADSGSDTSLLDSSVSAQDGQSTEDRTSLPE